LDLKRFGDGLDRDAEGEGGLLARGDGVLEIAAGSDLWGWAWASGTEIRSGAESGGVLTETNPGIVKERRACENETAGDGDLINKNTERGGVISVLIT
jgi:hypothetical protein